MAKKKLDKFCFEGFDKNGDPIIKDKDGKKVKADAKGPGGDLPPIPDMVVYKINPTWVYINGRWYRIG